MLEEEEDKCGAATAEGYPPKEIDGGAITTPRGIKGPADICLVGLSQGECCRARGEGCPASSICDAAAIAAAAAVAGSAKVKLPSAIRKVTHP